MSGGLYTNTMVIKHKGKKTILDHFSLFFFILFCSCHCDEYDFELALFMASLCHNLLTLRWQRNLLPASFALRVYFLKTN